MKTILIIDDNEELAQIYGEILDMEGFNVKRASSGQQALQILEDLQGIDLILVDCNMPGMSGEEFLTELRFQMPNICQKVPIVGLSAFRETDHLTEQFRSLTTAFVHKPDSIEDFLNVVKKYTSNEFVRLSQLNKDPITIGS